MLAPTKFTLSALTLRIIAFSSFAPESLHNSSISLPERFIDLASTFSRSVSLNVAFFASACLNIAPDKSVSTILQLFNIARSRFA